jgi:hypothetical protein
MYQMEDLGVSVISTSQGIDTTTSVGRMAADLYATISEEEWKLIRDRMNDGRQEKAEAQGYIGGPASYGLRIVGKGAPGSYLEPDEREIEVLELAAALAIGGESDKSIAAALNAAGYTDRQGRPWTRRTVRNLLTSDAVLKGISVFRKTKSDAHGRPQTKMDDNGNPLFGRTVVVALPETIDAETRKALRNARSLRRREAPRQLSEEPYILTGQLFGTCGRNYHGGSSEAHRARTYRFGGAEDTCGDPPVLADAVEVAVWGEVVNLLQDRQRMMALAREWMTSLPQDHDNYLTRAAALRDRVTALDKSLSRAVRLEVESDDPEIAQSAKALQRELAAELKERRADLEHVEIWLREYDESASEVHLLSELAESARLRLDHLTALQKQMLIRALQVEVHVQDAGFRRKAGRPCPVTAWHLETGTLVPDEVQPAEWEPVRALLVEWHGPHHFDKVGDPRLVMNAVLHRLRTGTPWAKLPAEFGTWKQSYMKLNAWWKGESWPVVVSLLNERGGGSPAPSPDLLPPLKISGRLSLDLVTSGLDSDEVSDSAATVKKAVSAARASRSGGPPRCS